MTGEIGSADSTVATRTGSHHRLVLRYALQYKKRERKAVIAAVQQFPMRTRPAVRTPSTECAEQQEVLVHPRTKQGVPRQHALIAVNRAMAEALFHLPQKDAAEALMISVTSLKSVCRTLGIEKWPYEKASSIEKAPTDHEVVSFAEVQDISLDISLEGKTSSGTNNENKESCKSCVDEREQRDDIKLSHPDKQMLQSFGHQAVRGANEAVFEPADDVRVDATFIQSFVEEEEEEEEVEKEEVKDKEKEEEGVGILFCVSGSA